MGLDIIRINDKISYIEATNNPLSADIGIIRDENNTWLFDVGCGEQNIVECDGHINIVLSHFHKDHAGNVNNIKHDNLFVSKETYDHVKLGTIVGEDYSMGNVHIFTLPSSHAKGCLGLEIDKKYAFVGDALYCKVKDDFLIYNAQLLKEEINVLKRLDATYLLVSHYKGLVRDKGEVIKELEDIYNLRKKSEPEIKLPNLR